MGKPYNRAASADLIKQHVCQIQGIDGTPFTYLVHKALTTQCVSSCSDECTNLFDDQMIKRYPILNSQLTFYQSPGA